jgi:hypothetical protein
MRNMIKFALTIINIMTNGLLFNKAWLWFMVPTLQVPAFGIGASIGIALALSAIVYRTDLSSDEILARGKEKGFNKLGYYICLDLIILGYLYVIYKLV